MATRSSFRASAIAAVLLALGAIAFLTLNPGGIVGPLRGAFVGELFELTGGRGAGVDLERVLNLVLFVPFGAAVAAIVPWRWGFLGILAGLAVSTGVEVMQGAIPGRVSDPADIVWNTAGAAVGAVIVLVPRAAMAGLRRVRALSRRSA